KAIEGDASRGVDAAHGDRSKTLAENDFGRSRQRLFAGRPRGRAALPLDLGARAPLRRHDRRRHQHGRARRPRAGARVDRPISAAAARRRRGCERKAALTIDGLPYDTALRSPNIRASCSSTGVTALNSRAPAASTESPAVSTTAEAREYSGSRLIKMLRNSAIAERSSAI